MVFSISKEFPNQQKRSSRASVKALIGGSSRLPTKKVIPLKSAPAKNQRGSDFPGEEDGGLRRCTRIRRF
ncbi:hypothetical protein U1Q18_006560 [Sarracenia purpurea var. burkii]